MNAHLRHRLFGVVHRWVADKPKGPIWADVLCLTLFFVISSCRCFLLVARASFLTSLFSLREGSMTWKNTFVDNRREPSPKFYSSVGERSRNQLYRRFGDAVEYKSVSCREAHSTDRMVSTVGYGNDCSIKTQVLYVRRSDGLLHRQTRGGRRGKCVRLGQWMSGCFTVVHEWDWTSIHVQTTAAKCWSSTTAQTEEKRESDQVEHLSGWWVICASLIGISSPLK